MQRPRPSLSRVLLLLLAGVGSLCAAIWLALGAQRSVALEERAGAPGAPAPLELGVSIENEACAAAALSAARRESAPGPGASLVRAIRGRVVRGDGRPAARVRVCAASVALRSVHPSEWSESPDPPGAECDDDGGFELRYRGPAELVLVATDDGRFGLPRVFGDGEQQAELSWDDYRIEVALAGERDARDPGTLTCRRLPDAGGLWGPSREPQHWSGEIARFEVEPEHEYRVSWVSARRPAVVHDVHVRAEDLVTHLVLDLPPELEPGSVAVTFEAGPVAWDAVNVSAYCLPSEEVVCSELSTSDFRRAFVPGEYLLVAEARELPPLAGRRETQLAPLRRRVRVYAGQVSELTLRFERAAGLELTLLDARERAEAPPVAWREPRGEADVAQAWSSTRERLRPSVVPRPWSIGLRAADGRVERPTWHEGTRSVEDEAQHLASELRNLAPNAPHTVVQPLAPGSYEVWVRVGGTTRLAGEIVLEAGRTLRTSFTLAKTE